MTAVEDDDDLDRLLGSRAAQRARDLAAREGVEVPKLIQRAIGLYALWVELDQGEQLMVRRADDSLERVVRPGADEGG